MLRLQFALDLFGEQTVEELHRDGAEFLEALPQQGGALAGIVAGMMPLEDLPPTGHGSGQKRVPGDFVQAGRVDDDLGLRDAAFGSTWPM